MSDWKRPSDSAGAAAVAAAVVATAIGRAGGAAGASSCCGGGGTGATSGSGSRISALNPLPNAFLGISDNLLSKLNIAFSAFTMYVVEHYRQPVTRRLCQAYVSRNNRFESLRAEETAKIGGYLLRQRGAVVI